MRSVPSVIPPPAYPLAQEALFPMDREVEDDSVSESGSDIMSPRDLCARRELNAPLCSCAISPKGTGERSPHVHDEPKDIAEECACSLHNANSNNNNNNTSNNKGFGCAGNDDEDDSSAATASAGTWFCASPTKYACRNGSNNLTANGVGSTVVMAAPLLPAGAALQDEVDCPIPMGFTCALPVPTAMRSVGELPFFCENNSGGGIGGDSIGNLGNKPLRRERRPSSPSDGKREEATAAAFSACEDAPLHVDATQPIQRLLVRERGSRRKRKQPLLTHLGRYSHLSPDITVLQDHLTLGGVLDVEDALRIIRSAALIFAAEPNVLTLEDPITVCGDIHGQFYDLLTLLKMAGSPETTQYLFLGDYVDRGCFSCEVTLLLFAMKLKFPSSVWLLRGNHECRHLSTFFNFKEECLHKYSVEVYDAFQAAFDRLPLAAVIGDSFLCVHGGLSPDVKTVDDISRIFRFREPPTSGAMCDLMWSDPMDDDEEQLCPDAMFLHNEMRGCSYVYSSLAAEQFLRTNQLISIIRAHEAQEEGFRMFRKVRETGFPSVMCVFSAPNYCDTYNNKASFMQLTSKVIRIRQYNAAPHPYILPNFMNAFTWSLPFLYDKMHDALEIILLDDT